MGETPKDLEYEIETDPEVDCSVPPAGLEPKPCPEHGEGCDMVGIRQPLSTGPLKVFQCGLEIPL